MDDGSSDQTERKPSFIVSFEHRDALESFKRYSRDNGIEVIREFFLTNSVSVASDASELLSLREIFPDGNFVEDTPGDLEE